MQMQYRGVTSDKRKLLLMLEGIYKKVNSEKSFYTLITKKGFELYQRKGKIIGIVSNRKYRLKSLGYTQEIIQELSKKLTKNKRMAAIQKIRGRNWKGRSRGRNI